MSCLRMGLCHSPQKQPTGDVFYDAKGSMLGGSFFFSYKNPGFGFFPNNFSHARGASKQISGNSVKLSVAGSTVFGSISTGPWGTKSGLRTNPAAHCQNHRIFTRVKRWHSQTNKNCRIHSTPGWKKRESFPTCNFRWKEMAIFPIYQRLVWEAPKRSWNVRPDSARYVNLKAWPIHCEPTIPAWIPTPFMPPLPPEGTKTQHPTDINGDVSVLKVGSIIEYHWFPSQLEDENWKKRLGEKMV